MAKDQGNALPAGYQLDDYRIEAVLGAGGFGITYRAHEGGLNRLVAIKEYLPRTLAMRSGDNVTVLPVGSDDVEGYDFGLSRFRDEAQTLVQFRHPNIVQVFKFIEANGTAYLVMEYAEGKSLQALLDTDDTLTENECREILFPLLDGLEQVHSAGFLHRDIKPDNIVIRKDGTPVLIDFGSARQALGEKSKSLTTVVSPGYAPFEQYKRRGRQGPWTDIYALGATLYHAITGDNPIAATDRIEQDRLVSATEAAGNGYSLELLDAVDRALTMRAEDRPQNIAEWRKLLGEKEVEEEVPEAAPVRGKETKPPSHGPREPPASQPQGSPKPELGEYTGAYERGDYATAFSEYKALAEQGEAIAQNNLGVMYAKGQGVPKNDREAVKWYRKAAEQGDADAQCNLGVMYDEGQGVPKNDREAAEWYRKAAEQGYGRAQLLLDLLLFGPEAVVETLVPCTGCGRNLKRGVSECPACGAEQPDWDEYDEPELEECEPDPVDPTDAYERGDHATAFREYKQAAGQGNADAQRLLGLLPKETKPPAHGLREPPTPVHSVDISIVKTLGALVMSVGAGVAVLAPMLIVILLIVWMLK